MRASLGLKLIVPSLVGLMSFALLVVFAWMPVELEGSRRDFENGQIKLLKAMQPDIVRHVLAHDFAALHSSIDQQMQHLAGTWLQLELYRAQNGRRLYPLAPADHALLQAQYPYLVEVLHKVELDGELFVTITVVADWSVRRQQTVDSVSRLSIYLFAVFLGFTALGFSYQNRIFRRPLLQLTRSTQQIANGNFNVSLPQAGSDEIGDLTHSFELMRDNLQHSQQRLQQALDLAKSREMFQRNVLQSMAEGLITVNEAGHIISANAAADSIFGCAEGELRGRSMFDLMPAATIAEHRKYLRGGIPANAGMPNIMGRIRRVKGQRADGSVVPLEITVTQMESGGARIYNALLRDITEREQAEAALVEAKQRAESASDAKSRFLATMSHEIRTPMNGVLGMLQLLDGTSLDDKQQEYVDTASSSGELLLTVINDILDYSKMESGQLRLETIPFDPHTIVEDTVTLLAKSAFDKGIELICSLDPQIPGLVRGDPMRLRQILTNLTNNAIKFTEQGEVLLYAHMSGSAILFGVRDTGIGMSTGQLDKLFQSFSQVDDSHSRKYGGTGLGLAICQHLASAMHSQIEVHSDPGRGSEFSFALELEVVELQREWQEYSKLLPQQRILIVDDNQTNREVLSNLLESWQVRGILQASSGHEALSLIGESMHHRQPVDIVLLDLNMPHMDGLQTAARIRQDESFAAIRLVMLSSSDIDPGAQGIDMYLAKPVRQSDLYNALISLLELRQPKPVRGARKDNSPRPDFSAYRVLLVEDNHVNQLVARGILAKAGFDIEIRENGADAVSAVQSKPYDLVLMDIQMPIMDGLEATRAIRQLGGVYAELPIIAMTANVLEADAHNCLQAGMNAHIGKPIDANELYASIGQFLPDAGQKARPEALHDEPQSELANLDHIDTTIGLQHMRGDIQAYRKVLISFRERQHNAVDELLSYVEDERWEAARRGARTLKGAAANVGAKTLAQAAADVHESCRMQDVIAAREGIEKLRVALEKVLCSLDILGE
jgi:PAS domain S-box-containing protein